MPLLWLSLVFLLGIFLGEFLNQPLETWLVLAGAGAGLAFLPRLLARRAVYLPRLSFLPLPAGLLLVSLALGGARWTLALPDRTVGFIGGLVDQETDWVIDGLVTAPPDERDQAANLTVAVRQVRRADENNFTPAHGSLLAHVAPGSWRYGDVVRLRGPLLSPPEWEGFSYRNYLARQGIYAYMPRATVQVLAQNQGSPILAALYAFRAYTLALVYRLYPDPAASLVAGVLLGIDAGIPEDVQQAFRLSGTAHIVAISGFNITLVSALFAAGFSRWLGKRRGALAAAAGIAFYTVLAGASASVVRAALMGGVSLLAAQIGRRQNGLNSLAFVAALMTLGTPSVLWDVGFQLSFAATLGLVLYAGPLTQAFERLALRWLPQNAVQRVSGPVGEYLLFTLAAQITTLPLLMYYYQQFSPVSLLANPFLLPAQPPLMYLGGLSVLAGLALLPLGQLAAYLAWPFAAYTIRGAEFFAALPGASINLGAISGWGVALLYGLLFAWTSVRPALQRRAGPAGVNGLAARPLLLLSALGAVTALVWQTALTAPDGRLHLALLDVNANQQTGLAVLVQSPGGRYVLVGGGPSPRQLSQALGRRLPVLHRRLDWIVVISPENRHIAALPDNLTRFPPSSILWAGAERETSSARELQAELTNTRLPVVTAQAGQALDLGQGAALRVLASGKAGAVLLLSWQNFNALLVATADQATLDSLQSVPLPAVTALVMASGGEAQQELLAWQSQLHPQVILFSSAADSRRSPPKAEALGGPLLRTDLNGWLELTSDGKNLWLQAEKR